MKKLALMLMALLLLVSCTEQEKMPDDNIRWVDVYYERAGDKLIGSEPFALSAEDNISTMITKVVEKMSEKPVADDLFPALPKGCSVQGVKFDDGTAIIDLSREYLTMSGIDKTIADTCILTTIAEFLNVSALQITVDGVPQGEVLHRTQIIRDEPKVIAGTDEITLYLRDASGKTVPVEHTVLLEDGILPEQVAAEYLVSGKDGYKSPLPDGCELYSIAVNSNVCHVNFSSKLLSADESEAYDMVSAIVLSLTSIDYVDRVKITVDNQEVRGFKNISLRREYTAEYFKK